MASSTQTTLKRHNWTRSENEELMTCYYAVHPSERGFRRRLFELWHQRNCDTIYSSFSEQKLCGQVRSLLKREYFSDVELNRLELKASSLLNSSDETESDSETSIGSNGVELEHPQPFTNDSLLYDDENLTLHSDSSIPCVPDTVLSEYQSVLFDKVVFYMENIDDQVEKLYLQPMRGSQMSRVMSIIKEMNFVLCRVLISSLMDLCNAIYCAARVVTEECIKTPHKSNPKQSQSPWEVRLLCKIRKYKQDLSRMLSFSAGKLLNQSKINDLVNRYALNCRSVVVVCEEVRQTIKTLSHRLAHYRQRRSCHRQNQLFTNNQHKFYQLQLGKHNDSAEPPPREETLHFWNELWGKPAHFNKNASWLSSFNPGATMSFTNLDTNDFFSVMKRMPNWKSPGPDLIHGFWLKKFSSLHNTLLFYFNDLLLGKSMLDPKLATGRTVLIIKDPNKGSVPTNYRPITCLSSVYKLLTGILRLLLYRHFDFNCFIPSQQKGCTQRSKGTKDHLLVDKMIMTDAKRGHKNLFMSWIDLRKAYDSVPHDWILFCLKSYGVHPKIIDFLQGTMKLWSTTLNVNSVSFGRVHINRGIFQGDSLSPLLFIMCLAPLSDILNRAGKGFHFSGSPTIVSHFIIWMT